MFVATVVSPVVGETEVVEADVRVVHNAGFVGPGIADALHAAREDETEPLLLILLAGSCQRVQLYFWSGAIECGHHQFQS